MAERHIALVCPYDLSVPGGVQNQVSGLAKALAARDFDVSILAPGATRLPDNDRITVVDLGRSLRVRANGSLAPVAPFPTTMRRTAQRLRALQADIVHVHEPFAPGPSLAAAFAHIAPTIATFHRSGAGVAYKAARPLARRVFSRLDDAVVVSPAAHETLCEVLGREVSTTIANNAVDLERFAVAPWPTDGLTICFIGRHEHRKGLAVLLDAFCGSQIEACLWIIGDGPETEHLKRRYGADSRLDWCGPLDDHLAVRRLVGADIVVAPSLGGESFGIVVREAFAAHSAVIASDLQGYRSAGLDAVRYVAPGNTTELRQALVEVSGDPRKREQLVQRGEKVVRTADFSHLGALYLERYEVASNRYHGVQ